jgi:hypothetical protein
MPECICNKENEKEMFLKVKLSGMILEKKLIPGVFVWLLLAIFPLNMMGQSTPDTVVANYNQSLAGSSWQYSFVQITDIHIGEGAPGDDYGTPGYFDNISMGDAGDPLIRLRNSVLWINQHINDLKIHFVVVTGDMSESAEVSELLRCKQLLDSLEVPYIPMIGNHDVWPLSQGLESPVPDGDSLVNVMFADVFTGLSSFFPDWNNGTRLDKTWDTEDSCYSYFENFSFSYGSYAYIMTDFNSRAHDIAVFNGSAADAQLHDFGGGTWPWLQQTIINYPVKGQDNILIFAHHPLSKSLLTGSFASFDVNEYDVITQFLLTYKDCIGAWIAGHKHNVDEYNIKTWTFSPTIAVGYEAAANWEYPNGHFRIFKMWDTAAPTPLGMEYHKFPELKVFPNPCTDQIEIQWEQNIGAESVELYNQQGQLIFTEAITIGRSNKVLNMGAYPSGYYFLRLKGLTDLHTVIVLE